MAEMIEARGSAFLSKCKGVSLILTAVSGLALGVINIVRPTDTSVAKGVYVELGKQVEGMSRDVKHLAETLKFHQDQISNIQNWIIYESRRSNAMPSPAATQIKKYFLKEPSVILPPPRKPMSWDVLQSKLQGG